MVWKTNPNRPDVDNSALVDQYLKHNTRVAEICKEVRHHYDDARDNTVFKKAPCPYNAPEDISGLDSIISIDGDCRHGGTAEVEANVTMESLVKTTLAHGLVPSVVACQRSTTVAQAFANMTNESSSFLCGTFDCTVLEVEIISGNGDVVKAGPNEKEDLFYGLAGTMNSLGLTTMFKISLKSLGPYVELEFLSSPPCLSDIQIDLSIATQQAMQEKQISLKAMEHYSSILHMAEEDLQNAPAEVRKRTSLHDMAIEKVRRAKTSPSYYTAVKAAVRDTEGVLTALQKSSSLIDSAMNHAKTAIGELEKQLARLAETAESNKAATDECLTKASLVSMTMATMLWASSDSSAEFVEAMIFEDESGVVIGRTCPSKPDLLFKPSAGNSFTDLARSVLREKIKGKIPQVRYMETESYLFRNDTARPGRSFTRQEKSTANVPFCQIAVCSDAIEELMEGLQPHCKAWPWRICPILSPRISGHKPSHGIGSKFGFPNHVYLALAFPHIIETGEIDTMLAMECARTEARRHTIGFRFLHCHLRGPHLLPWSAHDDKTHRSLRKKWLALVPDVDERLGPGYQNTSPQCSSATTSMERRPEQLFLGRRVPVYFKRHST
jgi:hypothetical protein